MEKKFVLPADRVEILRQNLSHIVSLFKEVQVRLLDVDKDTGQQWVSVSCSTLIANKTEVLDKVKEYIATALCDPEAVTIPLQLDKYPAFRQPEQVVNLEKMFKVVAIVDEVSRELKIKGSDINVALAESWIDENHSSLIKDAQDSDLVVPDAGSLNPSLREFALKLGYSEKDVNSVAKKFGSDVDQNRLLRELIQHKGKSRTDPRITESTHRGGTMKTGQIVARGASAHSRGSTRATEVAPAISRGAGYPMTPYAGTQGLSSCDDSLNSLVPIVIDGSNVAMNHGNQQVFSCRGIELCVNWFKGRGHKEIYAFVPRWRTETPRPDHPISNQHILHKLASQNFVKFSPSRRVAGRNIVCYDDRFIVDLAYKLGGVIVSNDNYRDLQRENPEWRDVIENRLLMYSFAGDYFMVPDDPLGKHGPTLKEFLQKGTKSHPRICPHISRCTYGSKCRYYHPERDPKRRQELLSGKPRQVSRVSTAYDTRNQFLRDSGPTEIPLRQQQPYQPLSSITTSQHYTYSAQPYTSYNNSICPSNENIPDKDYDHTYAKFLDMFSEDEEKVERAMKLYCCIKDVESVIDILLNEDTS